MASTARASVAQSVPLQPLSTQSTAQIVTMATEQNVSHQPDSVVAPPQHEAGSSQVQMDVQQPVSAATPQSSAGAQSSQHSLSSPVQHPVTGANGDRKNRVRLANAIGILGLLLTLAFGLLGIPFYKDLKWTEKNTALQSCAALFVCDVP